MPADHYSLIVPAASLEPLIAFLTSSLQHLGFREHWRPVPFAVGLGEEHAYMWIAAPGAAPKQGEGSDYAGGISEEAIAQVARMQHIAFVATSMFTLFVGVGYSACYGGKGGGGSE